MVDYCHLRDSARYQSQTLMGNWNEERELRRSTLKDLISKKTTGTLRLDAFSQRMGVALQEIELSKSRDDEYVHFGDVLQLVHLETGFVLACDVGDADPRPGEMACSATAATQVTAPCARNSLILVRYEPAPGAPLEPDYPDDTLRYGQKVQLAVHPRALGEAGVDSAGGPRPLRLFSKPMSTTHYAKYSRKQLVGFTHRNSYDTVWEIATPDPSQRSLSLGVEVMAGAPVMLIHSATQKPLLVEDQKYPNDFGMERELSARTSASKGMKSVCEMTTRGLLKGTLPKSEASDTYWALMPGSKVVVLPEPRCSMSATQAAALRAVQAIAQELQQRQGNITALERKLVTWSTSSQQLPAEEVILLLRQVGLLASDEWAEAVVSHFRLPAKPGYVDASSFLAALRNAAGISTNTMSAAGCPTGHGAMSPRSAVACS